MATMWPRILPDWVLADSRRAAEISVFRRLEKLLDNTWSIFYSRPWWGIGPQGGELDGEADFIVVHPDHGLLFLEVKGGRISYEPELQQWRTKDRYGITHKIKDPVSQACTCKHEFLKKLKEISGWPKFFVRFRHGVIFPDCVPPSNNDSNLGSYERRLFCYQQEFDYALDRWILERLAPHPSSAGSPERGPRPIGVKIIHDLLANPVVLRVPLVRVVQGEINTMENLLTGAQLTLISMVDSEQRALVEGGAGTGKTVLAMEMAARYAENGHSVLYCCMSGPLASRVAEKMSKYKNITVLKFDELAALFNWKHGQAAVIPTGKAWDVVLVDEGQDFDWDWWELIDQVILKDSGKLRVFADSNQAVYRLRADLETRLDARSFPLRINLRNTKAIAKATEALYEGPLIEAHGPDGTLPTCDLTSFESAENRAIDVLLGMIRDEKCVPSMIAILVPDANTREQIRGRLSKMGVATTDASRIVMSAVTVETVARFKGLEAPIVLLLADKNLARNQEMSYVGVSRARARLLVFGPIIGSILESAIQSTHLAQS